MLNVLERSRTYVPTHSQFIIETNVPVPPRRFGNGRVAKYPFALMEVGESFEAPLSSYNSKRPTTDKLLGVIYNCARNYAKTHKPHAKFAVRKTGETTVRCWRVA